MKLKIGALFCLIILSTALLFTPGTDAQPTVVSDPGKANKLLSDFETPIIRPGNQGVLELNLTNEYEEQLTQIRFTVDLYRYADLDLEKNITKVSRPPVFDTSGETSYTHTLSTLPSNDTYPMEYTIKTDKKTEEGVYFVRFKMEFDYGPTENDTVIHSLMKSKGYFTDSQWENATKRPGQSDEPYYAGSINITYLNVDGILPDSSFSVKTPIPQWPRYALAAAAAFFGIMAVMLYMQEEYNSFPWLEDILNYWSSKFKQFRRRLKHRLGKP